MTCYGYYVVFWIMHYFKMVIFCKKLQLKKLNLVTLKILFFGVFGYTLFQNGHILQKVTTKKLNLVTLKILVSVFGDFDKKWLLLLLLLLPLLL